MPRSSRHKSHKQSKHSSRDYSDSEEDVIKMKEKTSKDDNSVRVHRDSASGEKRKISSQVREGKDSKDLSGHGNGDVVEEYVSSKRRKEKTDVVGGDRWNGGGDERGDIDRNVEKEMQKGESLKVDSRVKETSSKGDNLRTESKTKSKRYESGVGGERKEDSLASVVVDREDSKIKGDSKRKSERDSSSRKEGKELKDKDRRLDKEKFGCQESKSGDAEVKIVEIDVGKKQGSQLGEFSEERLGKRARENSERTLLDEARNPELEKEVEKRIRKKRDGSNDREKHYEDSKEGDERRLSSKGDRARDVKYRDDKYKDGGYADKYLEDGHKDDRRRDEKYKDDADKDYKHRDARYREDGEKDARRRDDRHREDGDRDIRRKDDKHREDGERDSRRKDEKNREGIEREGRRDDKYYEDGDRDIRRKDDRYHEDGDKDIRRGDERYHEDGDRDDRRKDSSYRDDGDRDYRHKEEKYRDDIERDTRHMDSKQGDGFDRDKRPRDSKYRDERTTSRDRSGEKSDVKRSKDDSYAADHYARKSNAYDDSPTHDDRAARYRDDQSRRRTNEKEDYSDNKSRATKDQKSDAEKKSSSSARIDPAIERGRSTSRNADVEHTSSHGRRRGSPTSNSHAARDHHHRALKQDESKYRDYNYEERVRPSTRDYTGTVGGSEKTSSRSIEKLGQKDDGHFGELSAERRLKSDIRSSPLQLVDKSPSSSTDRRQFRSDVRRSIDLEESTPRSGGSRDWKEYSGKDVRGGRESGMDVHPGEELTPADTDTISISSPFVRNSHFSSSSKSLPPPPPFRTGVDSPLISGSGEDDGRGKSNIRHRRMGDPNMGRIQGNPWRGVPSWPSPVANGFLPFPHAPPPVGFHSVMQPFPAPPMFSIRPSMELSHPGAYHMPDSDRFSGAGRPMGWRNQVDDSCPPIHAWDASNTVFGDESHIYGRSDWDHSRNLPGSRGWETSGDFWKGPNRTESMEVPSFEKESNSIRSGDEAFTGQSIQPFKNEQNLVDQLADSTDISQPRKSYEKNDVEASLISPEDTGDVAKVSRREEVPVCHVYFSKLDISADLTEPELFNRCTGLIGIDQTMSSLSDDSKILYIEDIEAKTVSHRLLNYALFGSNDDSVFQKSMSLYKRQKEHFSAEDSEILKVSSELILMSDQENENIEDDKTEKLCPAADDAQGVEDALPNIDIEVDPDNGTQKTEVNSDTPVGITAEKSEDPVSDVELINKEDVNSVVEENNVEEMPLSAERVEACDACPEEPASNNEEGKSVDTKCDPLISSDVFSEAMMPESVVPGSVNLSRIHDSPESTH